MSRSLVAFVSHSKSMLPKGSSGEGFVGLGMEWPMPSNYSLTPLGSPEAHAFPSERSKSLPRRPYVVADARVNWSGYDQLVHFRHVLSTKEVAFKLALASETWPNR